MTTDILEKWNEMLERAAIGSSGRQFLRADGKDGDPDLRVYRSHPQTELPAIEVRLSPSGRGNLRPRRYQGFELAIETLQWGSDKPAEMAVICCRVESLEDVFLRFVQTIIDSLASGSAPHVAVSTAVDRWVSFFAKRGGQMNPQELMGLFGELYFLRERLKTGKRADTIIDAWKGPEGGLWDFVIPRADGVCYVEVKTTGLDKRRVVVNGLDQLWAAEPSKNKYWLLWLRANWYRRDDGSDNGSIFELVNEVQGLCSRLSEESRAALDEVLRMAGLLDIDQEIRQVYQSVKINGIRPSWIAVGPNFPALHRTAVSNQQVLDRVTELKYSLLLKDEDVSQEVPDFKDI